MLGFLALPEPTSTRAHQHTSRWSFLLRENSQRTAGRGSKTLGPTPSPSRSLPTFISPEQTQQPRPRELTTTLGTSPSACSPSAAATTAPAVPSSTSALMRPSMRAGFIPRACIIFRTSACAEGGISGGEKRCTSVFTRQRRRVSTVSSRFSDKGKDKRHTVLASSLTVPSLSSKPATKAGNHAFNPTFLVPLRTPTSTRMTPTFARASLPSNVPSNNRSQTCAAEAEAEAGGSLSLPLPEEDKAPPAEDG